MRGYAWALGAALVFPFGCEETKSVGLDDPANAAGKYSLAITNGKNGCAFDGWKEGETAMDIPLTVVQTGAEVTASVGGITGVILGIGYGSADYKGMIVGNQLSLTLFGKNAQRSGNCTYTMNSVVRAEIKGDFLTGVISHQPAGNGNPDCAKVACSTEQAFNGSRPPTVKP